MDIIKYEEAVGWIAGGLTICFYMIEITPFINVIRNKVQFNDTPIFYITASFFNYFLWFIYGEIIFDNAIKITNFIVSIICIFSIGIYLIYEIKKYFFDTILNILILSMVSWAIYRILTRVLDDDLVIGKICIGTSIIKDLDSIYIVYHAIIDKNYDLIKYIKQIFYILISFLWIVYGIITVDFNIIISYIFGIIFSLLQISIYLNYKKKYCSFNNNIRNSNISSDINKNEEYIKEESSIKIDDYRQSEEKQKPVKIIDKIDNN